MVAENYSLKRKMIVVKFKKISDKALIYTIESITVDLYFSYVFWSVLLEIIILCQVHRLNNWFYYMYIKKETVEIVCLTFVFIK